MISESPAPFASYQTPKLSAPKNGSREIDLDTSADLFATPEPRNKVAAPTAKRARYNLADGSAVPAKPARRYLADGSAVPDLAVNPVRITSASTVKPPSVAVREPQDISNRPVQFALDIIVKRGQVDAGVKRAQSSVFREGYNGFGGHEKVVMPRPKLLSSSVVGSKKPIKKMFGPSKTSSFSSDKNMPPLPTLPSFMSTDNSADFT